MGTSQSNGYCLCSHQEEVEETEVNGIGSASHNLDLRGSFVAGRPQDLQPEVGREAILGCSSIGTVLRARNQRSKVVHALRQISKKMLEGCVMDEVRALRPLNHPHICKLHDTWEDPVSLYMIMDLCNGGNLTDLGATQEHLSEDSLAGLVEQMVSATNHLHEHSIVHGDLRPENWLFKEQLGPSTEPRDMELKMIDFGLASKHSKRGSRIRPLDPSVPGTSSSSSSPPPSRSCHSQTSNGRTIVSDDSSRTSHTAYSLEAEPLVRRLFCKAPEQVASKDKNAVIDERNVLRKVEAWEAKIEAMAMKEKADCWALGVMTYFMLSGQSPFPFVDKTPEQDTTFMNARFVFMPTHLWRPISSEAKNFIAICLHKDPKVRPTAGRLLRMPWMQRARGEIKSTSLLAEGGRLPTSQNVLLSLERMRRLQLVERAATIATAFRLSKSELEALPKAFAQRDVAQLGFLPVQELLHVLVNEFDVNCDDLAILVQESTPGDGCNIAYSAFVSDVLDFQENAQDSVLWEVFSRLGGASPQAQLPKRLLLKALDGGEYQQSITTCFPQLSVPSVCKELQKDAKGRLDFEAFRQVLQEAKSGVRGTSPPRRA